MTVQLWSETQTKTEAYRQRRLAGVTIDITNRCDAGCKYCYNSSTNDSKQYLDSERVLRLIDEAKSLGVFEITWGGGEPLLHSDLPSFVEHAAQLGIVSRVTTSGQPISQLAVAERLTRYALAGKISELRIQINTINREQFLSVRNTYPEFFDELMLAFLNLKQIGFPIQSHLSICIVYVQGCVDSFEETCLWAVNDLGIQPGNIMTVGFKERGFGIRHPELRAEEEDLRRCRNFLKQLTGTSAFENEYSEINCATVVHVSPNGSVIPCALLPIPHGNINHESLQDIVSDQRGPAARKREILDMAGGVLEAHACAGTVWDERPDVRNAFKRRHLPVITEQAKERVRRQREALR